MYTVQCKCGTWRVDSDPATWAIPLKSNCLTCHSEVIVLRVVAVTPLGITLITA